MIKNFKRFVEFFFFSLFYLAIFRTSGPIREQLYKQFFNKFKNIRYWIQANSSRPRKWWRICFANILDQIDFCFSPGVGHTSEFEKQISARNIKCFLADKNVDAPSNKNFSFIKKNLNSYTDENNITLDFWLIPMQKITQIYYYKWT